MIYDQFLKIWNFLSGKKTVFGGLLGNFLLASQTIGLDINPTLEKYLMLVGFVFFGGGLFDKGRKAYVEKKAEDGKY